MTSEFVAVLVDNTAMDFGDIAEHVGWAKVSTGHAHLGALLDDYQRP
jgi:hypothetical protein